MNESRPMRILRVLARSPGGLSTPQIADELDEGIESRQRALSWYGGILRSQVEGGTVEVAGKTPGGWQCPPAITWRITDEGTKLLAYIDDAPRRDAEREQANAELAETARRRAAALAEGVSLYSRDTPRPERWNAARRLRRLGCTLEEIGQLFGVTREMIRRDLLLTEEPPLPPAKAAVAARPPLELSGARTVRRPLGLSARQAEYLLGLVGRRDTSSYSHFITTGRALAVRGLIEHGSGVRLTREGRRVAELLAQADLEQGETVDRA